MEQTYPKSSTSHLQLQVHLKVSKNITISSWKRPARVVPRLYSSNCQANITDGKSHVILLLGRSFVARQRDPCGISLRKISLRKNSDMTPADARRQQKRLSASVEKPTRTAKSHFCCLPVPCRDLVVTYRSEGPRGPHLRATQHAMVDKKNMGLWNLRYYASQVLDKNFRTTVSGHFHTLPQYLRSFPNTPGVAGGRKTTGESDTFRRFFFTHLTFSADRTVTFGASISRYFQAVPQNVRKLLKEIPERDHFTFFHGDGIYFGIKNRARKYSLAESNLFLPSSFEGDPSIFVQI